MIKRSKVSLTVLAILVYQLTTSALAQPDSLQQKLSETKNEEKVKALNKLFKYYLNNDPFLAMSYAEEALSLSQKIKYASGIANSYNDIGVIHRKHGKLDLALENYLKAYEIFSETNEVKGLAKVYNNIGTIYSLQEDYDNALENYKNSYELLKSNNEDDDLIIGSLNNIGNVYREKGSHEEALKFYNEALALYKKKGKDTNSFEPLTSIGNIYFERKEYDKALDIYFQALDIERSNEDLYGQAFALNNIGLVYFNKSEYKMAISFQNQALNLAHKVESLRLLGKIYEALSKSYFANDDLLNAYNALQLYTSLKDSLNNKEMNKRLEELEDRFEFEKKKHEEEMKSMSENIERLTSEGEQKNILIIVILSMVVLSVLIGFIRKRFA